MSANSFQSPQNPTMIICSSA